MKNYKILFADLDGTLINTVSGEIFPKGVWDMKLRFDVFDKIKELKPDYVFIISNQGGIEKGFVNESHFIGKMEYICYSIEEYCGCRCYSDYCPSNNKDDKDRKPNTGMLEDFCVEFIGNDLNYIKSVSLMIGDASGRKGQFSDSDKLTAENFGIDYMDVECFIKEKKEQ